MMELVKQLKCSLSKVRQILLAFTKHLILRLSHDQLMVNAGYMAYITLFSLVPLIAVVLSTLSIFPSFEETAATIKSFVLHNFVPASSVAFERHLETFVANARAMTTVGIVFLFVVALMLISTIDKSLNYIWRVKHKRTLVMLFSIYWMILTLFPALIGASFGVSTYLSSLNILQIEGNEVWIPSLFCTFPFILTAIAFFGLYTLVPNRRIVL